MSPEAIDLLREICHRLDGLPAAIAAAIAHQRHAPRRLSRADEAALAALLPAISKTIGARTFSVRMLTEHAALDVGPAIALRGALASIGSPHKIGRLLLRAEGADIGGFRIVASGHSREGMLRTIVTIGRKTDSGE